MSDSPGTTRVTAPTPSAPSVHRTPSTLPIAELLVELLDLEPAPRAERLAELACASPALATELGRLVAAAETDVGPLERAKAEVAESAARRLGAGFDAPPEQVGAWRLGRRLGVGGMGEVFLGERVEGGFAQEAAIKLVRGGLASGETLERFRLERQVLARLHHPAIAALVDGGVAADGRPWFAMEKVDGEPITEFAARRELSVEQRVELVAQVAAAVAFAHRALVVHRDLKPSNILVDASGRPKLLDFGLAKLLETELDPGLTRTEMRALTPAYAAPEQVLGEPVTTATDVYSLGILLYELLTGELPHERLGAHPAELAARVARESFERPSARLRRATETGSAGERVRRAARLRGDLDTIVMKALAREPERRYPSAAAVEDDLRRFLDGRPVLARPDTLGYLAGKFVRRHRLGVAAGALVALSLVGGLTVALVQAGRAQRAAELATTEARRAEAESTRARNEGERATRMKDFLISVFQEASPIQRARGTPLSIEELLDAAEARIDTELADEPLLQADLWDDLAETRASAGDYGAASKLIDKALAAKRAHLGPDELSLVESLTNRGAIWNLLAGDAVRGLDRDRTPDPAARTELERSAAAGLAALEEAQAILDRRGERDAAPALNIAVNITHSLLLVENNDAAAVAAARATALAEKWRPGSPDAAMQHHNGAMIALRRGRNQEARREFETAIAQLERTVGPDHALVALPVLGLADLLENRLGDVAGSIPYYERALAIAARHYPEGNPERVEKERDLAEAKAKLARAASGG